jgi:acyl carrier protein
MESVITQRIRRFIEERFPLAKQRQLSEEDQMLESGLVDSLGVMEIVEFLEQEFNVSVLDEELKEENFASLKN